MHGSAVLLMSSSVLLSGATHAAAGDVAYPTRPVRLVVTAATGGSTDIVGRILAARLTVLFDQQVIVDNRPGGGGIVGTEMVARATPDAHTLLFAWASHTVTPSLFKVPYDAARDFAAVSLVATQPLLLIVNGALPATSVKDLIALAKAKPGYLREAVAGAGGVGHIAGEIFKLETGADITSIMYKGAGPAQFALMQGESHLSYVTPVSAVPEIRNGRLRALATSAVQRLTYLPEVPTFQELGIAKLSVTPWQGVFAPARTPRATIDKLQRSIAAVLKQPETVERLVATGSTPQSSTPEELAARVKYELDYFGRIIKSANIKVE